MSSQACCLTRVGAHFFQSGPTRLIRNQHSDPGFRCSAQLLRRLGAATSATSSSGQLGDWYARTVRTRPRHLVLCTNARTLLCVVVPLAPQNQLLERFVAAAQNRISQISAPATALLDERAALADVHIGRATNRSVIGSMNEFAYAVDAWFEHGSDYDLEALGLWLCDTPCFPLRTTWPWREAEMVLHAGGRGTEEGRTPP